MSTNNPLEFFNFLSLPVELRAECHKHIARDSKRLTFYDWGSQSSTYMRLLKTCHQIRDEAASYQPEIIELMVTKLHRILADLTAAPKSILDQIEIFSIDMTNSARHLSHEDDYGRSLEALPNLKEARVYNMLVEDLAFDNTGLTRPDHSGRRHRLRGSVKLLHHRAVHLGTWRRATCARMAGLGRGFRSRVHHDCPRPRRWAGILPNLPSWLCVSGQLTRIAAFSSCC